MDGVIKAHCMGMEFPKRDTDSPNVTWEFSRDVPESRGTDWLADFQGRMAHEIAKKLHREIVASLPTAADLDAVAEEQRVKEKTGAQIPNR